jgi:hypothetical protein
LAAVVLFTVAASVFFTGAVDGLALGALGFLTGSARGSTLTGGSGTKLDPSLSKCVVIELRAFEMATKGSSLGLKGAVSDSFFENRDFNAAFSELSIVLQMRDKEWQA